MTAAQDPQTLHGAPEPAGGARQHGSQPSGRARSVTVVPSWRILGVSGPADERIVALAGAQEGRVSRSQLLDAGLSQDQITGRLDRNLLVPCIRGVYALGHAEPTAHSAEIEALLTRPIGALVCAHRGAALYGFRETPDGVDLLVPRGQGGGHREGIQIHRTRRSEHLEPSFPEGIPTVSAGLVLLQIAADLAPRALEAALDEAFTRGCVNRDDVARIVAENPTAAGVALLRGLLERRVVGNPSRSWLQEQTLAALRRAGLPDPEMDAPIGDRFTADLFWREARVAVECDSFRWHSSRSAWARDRRKDTHCEEHGIMLVRVLEEDLTGDRLLRLVAKLAAAISGRVIRAELRARAS